MRPPLSPASANDLFLKLVSTSGACFAHGHLHGHKVFIGSRESAECSLDVGSLIPCTDDERSLYSLKSSKAPPCTIPYVVSSAAVLLCHNSDLRCMSVYIHNVCACDRV